jgi:hypothetical protein
MVATTPCHISDVYTAEKVIAVGRDRKVEDILVHLEVIVANRVLPVGKSGGGLEAWLAFESTCSEGKAEEN